jgi:hypothetical protein
MGAEAATADHLAQNSISGFNMEEFVKSCYTLNWYGQYKHAMKMAKRGVKEVQEQFGNACIEYAIALHVKASIEQHPTQAKESLEEALAIQEAHYGTQRHVDVASTLHNLAITVGDLGDTNRKKQLLEEVLAIQAVLDVMWMWRAHCTTLRSPWATLRSGIASQLLHDLHVNLLT